ncbi:hypothetical protein BC835DRAFT_347454 [Cytidiella melzeri]|nr:hypothetical protein BC835DRAFT_347454 [Cytidiella melzeri]
MALPAAMSHTNFLCGPAYRFGAHTFTPHHTAQDMSRQAHSHPDAATWWASPRDLYPVMSVAAFPSMAFSAPAYPCPPVQLPLQQYAIPPLAAIHNTRCAAISSPSVMSDTDASPKPSPDPQFVHVVCNAPLLAPKPLPYHSPTFLQFDLPDDDEDLSHPPYVSRPHKRKRAEDEDEAADSATEEPAAMKRRVLQACSARWPTSTAHTMRRSTAVSHAAPVASSGSYR